MEESRNRPEKKPSDFEVVKGGVSNLQSVNMTSDSKPTSPKEVVEVMRFNDMPPSSSEQPVQSEL